MSPALSLSNCFYLHRINEQWIKVFCRRSSESCEFKHDPAKRGTSNQKHSRSKSQEPSQRQRRISSSDDQEPFLDQQIGNLVSKEVQKAIQNMIGNSPRSILTKNTTGNAPETQEQSQQYMSWNQQFQSSQPQQQTQFPKSVQFQEFFPASWGQQQM